VELFFGRSILARKWPAKWTKTRQNDDENFQTMRRIVTIRSWDGAMRATPRTPRSCDRPRGSVSMRPLGLAGQRPLQARRCVQRRLEWNRQLGRPGSCDVAAAALGHDRWSTLRGGGRCAGRTVRSRCLAPPAARTPRARSSCYGGCAR
jgi:hypothetical protein